MIKEMHNKSRKDKMISWTFDYQTLSYIRIDGAHISEEYLEDMKGRYNKPTDKLLDALWELFNL